MNKISIILLSAGLILLGSCSSLPGDFTEKGENPPAFPDINGVTVPVNIAPLNFKLTLPSEKIVALFEGKNSRLQIHGKEKIEIPVKKWHNLLENNSDDSLLVTVYAKQKGRWIKYLPFRIIIKKTPVDPYPVSYTHLRAHETRHDLVCRL